MKTRKYFTSAIVAAGALLLAGSAPVQAQLTTTYTQTFDTGSSINGWFYWYSIFGNTTMTWDETTDAGNNTSSGSLLVSIPFTPGGNQQLFVGSFDDNWMYDFNETANGLLYSNVSFDILVAPTTTPDANGDFGALNVGFYNTGTMGSVTIPGSASNGWVHLSVPINQTISGINSVAAFLFSITSWNGYPTNTFDFWMDNVALNLSPAPPPPPPTLSGPSTPIAGLNLLDTTPGSGGDRYQVANTNDNAGGLSFVGQSSVTYSWTINTFPTNDPVYSYQAHFLIVSGPDSTNSTSVYPGPYDQAADYNLANCIFVALRLGNNGAGVLDFRYKTNEPQNSPTGGNAMIWNSVSPTNTAVNSNGWPIMPVCSLNDSNGIVGTWSLTFDDTTNVTISGPGGLTTNFVMDPASAALFADPATLILGAQPNTSGFTGFQDVVYSSFSLTGTPAAFTDNFLTDASLNTNFWENFSNDTNGAVLVPSSAAYWVGWTLPAPNYALVEATNLAGSNAWSSVTPITTIKNGAQMQALIATNALPGAKQGYFALVQRSFSQLLILLPGETNAPNTATGKIGTPAPFSQSGDSGGVLTFTVLAVDANWNPVPGITDTISTSDTGGGYTANGSQALVNGSGQFGEYFPATASDVTITATDVTTPTITPNTSTSFTVGP